MRGGGHQLRFEDDDARLAVVGEGRVVQIGLGANAVTKTTKGNNKLPAFESRLFFGQKVSLRGPFPPFVAASILFLGASADVKDCLIYDIVGPGVSDAPP